MKKASTSKSDRRAKVSSTGRIFMMERHACRVEGYVQRAREARLSPKGSCGKELQYLGVAEQQLNARGMEDIQRRVRNADVGDDIGRIEKNSRRRDWRRKMV